MEMTRMEMTGGMKGGNQGSRRTIMIMRIPLFLTIRSLH